MRNPRTLKTSDALAVAGVDSDGWIADANRGLFHEIAPAKRGGHRAFELDDVIAAKIYDMLCRGGWTRTAAADVADQVRRLMRQHSDLPAAYVMCAGTRLRPQRHVVASPPPADSDVLVRFSIAEMRAALEVAFSGFAS